MSQQEIKGGEISGIFLQFTQNEIKKIYSFLKDLEYKEDPKGLKEYILDEITEDEELEEPKKPFFQQVIENPDLIKQGAAAIQTLVNAYRQNKKK